MRAGPSERTPLRDDLAGAAINSVVVEPRPAASAGIGPHELSILVVDDAAGALASASPALTLDLDELFRGRGGVRELARRAMHATARFRAADDEDDDDDDAPASLAAFAAAFFAAFFAALELGAGSPVRS